MYRYSMYMYMYTYTYNIYWQMLGKKTLCSLCIYLWSIVFLCPLWLQFVFVSLKENNFSSFFWNDKSNQKKKICGHQLWNTDCKNKLTKKVVSKLLSPHFLALCLWASSQLMRQVSPFATVLTARRCN